MNHSIKLLAQIFSFVRCRAYHVAALFQWTHFLVFMMWADKIIWHAALLRGIIFLSDPTLVPFVSLL